MAMGISRMALWKIEQRYQKWGEEGLKDHKPGRLFEPLNPKFYDLVIKEWKSNKCGARKLHAVMKRKGFTVPPATAFAWRAGGSSRANSP